jgi:hypothetical protein
MHEHAPVTQLKARCPRLGNTVHGRIGLSATALELLSDSLCGFSNYPCAMISIITMAKNMFPYVNIPVITVVMTTAVMDIK